MTSDEISLINELVRLRTARIVLVGCYSDEIRALIPTLDAMIEAREQKMREPTWSAS